MRLRKLSTIKFIKIGNVEYRSFKRRVVYEEVLGVGRRGQRIHQQAGGVFLPETTAVNNGK